MKILQEPGYAAKGLLLVGNKGIICLDDAQASQYWLFPQENFESSSPRPR